MQEECSYVQLANVREIIRLTESLLALSKDQKHNFDRMIVNIREQIANNHE
jgi:hypothetical protein